MPAGRTETLDGGLVLSGHTDVVPVGQDWSSDPLEIRGDKRRRSCDMKGFIALAMVKV